MSLGFPLKRAITGFLTVLLKWFYVITVDNGYPKTFGKIWGRWLGQWLTHRTGSGQSRQNSALDLPVPARTMRGWILRISPFSSTGS